MGNLKRSTVTVNDQQVEVYYRVSDGTIAISSMWKPSESTQLDLDKRLVIEALRKQ